MFDGEGGARSATLLLAFAIFALWETFRPRRPLHAHTGRRWAGHALLWLAGNLAAGFVFRASAVAVAASVSGSAFGLLNRDIVPYWGRFAAAILLLDFARYGQHYLYHAIPALWRLHQVHHADIDYDWSTGLRFHPIEALVTQATYLAVIALLAPPAAAVLTVELADITQNLFVHANVAAPRAVDRIMRRVLITPEMHRIHHSEVVIEQNTNFGLIFPFWDRLLHTYRERADAGEGMTTGLAGVGNLGVADLFLMPFRVLQSNWKGGASHGQRNGPPERNQEA